LSELQLGILCRTLEPFLGATLRIDLIAQGHNALRDSRNGCELVAQFAGGELGGGLRAALARKLGGDIPR
jgi:hypothetical protein